MKKLITCLAVFLLIFSVAAVGITYFSISNANKAENETGINLYGTYDQNDLSIDSVTETHNGVEVNIPLIRGLKDTDVQDKINRDMYEKARLVIDKHPDINYANHYTYANFANVISISFNVGFEEDPYSERIHFNYNLVDGSPLKLEDLFVSDTNLVDIIRSAVYKQMALYGGYDRDTYVHYPNEEEVYKIVKGYLAEENKTFAFSPSAIFLYPKNHFAEVKMIDHADNISIYSKYTTKESIFTGEYPGFKNAFTCADTQYDLFDKIEYGYAEDNLWYDITISNYSDTHSDEEKAKKFEIFKNDIYADFESMKDEYRLTARENPDKFYIVLAKPNIQLYSHSRYNNGEWHYTYSDMAAVYNQIQVFEMPLELHDSLYRDKIIDTYRYQYFAMRGGAWLDTENPEGATVTVIDESSLYNYVTGEELTELEDIFYPDSNYLEVIEDEVKERLELKGYSADYDISDMQLEISGSYVEATIEPIDFTAQVYFSSFDKSTMKLFDREEE